MSNWEGIRKDDYQYKLDRMVDDWLVDKDIGNGYKDNFIRSYCSYNGTGSNQLDVSFYFRHKNRNGNVDQLRLIFDTFGEENLSQKIIQNGVEMTVGLFNYSNEKRNGDYWIGIILTTSKEDIDRELMSDVVYDRISFLIDKDTIEEHLGYEITEDIFKSLVSQGNGMGDDFEEWFIKNHIDEGWIKTLLEREKK